MRIELSADGFAVVGTLRAAYRKALQQALPPESTDVFIAFTGQAATAFRTASDT
ncbi:hypothetical protein QP157_20670 [Sphingomonas sp. LR61]|uniref:hypothetical protein n=1 Tax=Sphingomonas sp. LR61 TaxID=3050234 RepID=UPI002FE207C9